MSEHGWASQGLCKCGFSSTSGVTELHIENAELKAEVDRLRQALEWSLGKFQDLDHQVAMDYVWEALGYEKEGE